jgi:hypothetical protein
VKIFDAANTFWRKQLKQGVFLGGGSFLLARFVLSVLVRKANLRWFHVVTNPRASAKPKKLNKGKL